MPKNENTENPKNYKPVICLPMIYKLIITKYMVDTHLMPDEQKGCCGGSKGCKDQLII
jgi:hypothetical protein